jgi:hypothetical protein
VWIFANTAGAWSQQGAKLVSSDATGAGNLGRGYDLSMSLDGNTIAVGAFADAAFTGAAWIFTRTNGVWAQQGTKLVGTGPSAAAVRQGRAVALSGDGNTLSASGYYDSGNIGATWVYTRTNGVWTQSGTKLIGTGIATTAFFGINLAITPDGMTSIIDGDIDVVL